MALNLSKLFDRSAQPSFLRNINPDPEDAIALKEAKSRNPAAPESGDSQVA